MNSTKLVADGLQLKAVPSSADVYTDQYLPARFELQVKR
jgi:hypothetical protein